MIVIKVESLYRAGHDDIAGDIRASITDCQALRCGNHQPLAGLNVAEINHRCVLFVSYITSAANRSIGSTTGCTITEKAPTRAFSWLKAPTSAFTFKTLLRHYAKRALTSRSLNVKLGPRHKSWLVSIVSYSRPSLMMIASRTQFHVETPWGQRPFSIVS